MIRAYGSASSGVTSGVGLAIANTIASSAICASASAGMTRAPERPMNRSAPSMTSAGPPVRRSLLVVSANQRLIGAHRAVLVVGPVGRQRALGVAADDVVDAGGEQDLRHRDPGRAEADDQHVEVLDPLAGDLDRVEQRGEHDDRGAVLVVVEDRDVERWP